MPENRPKFPTQYQQIANITNQSKRGTNKEHPQKKPERISEESWKNFGEMRRKRWKSGARRVGKRGPGSSDSFDSFIVGCLLSLTLAGSLISLALPFFWFLLVSPASTSNANWLLLLWNCSKTALKLLWDCSRTALLRTRSIHWRKLSINHLASSYLRSIDRHGIISNKNSQEESKLTSTRQESTAMKRNLPLNKTTT